MTADSKTRSAPAKVDAEVGPRGALELLSQREISALSSPSQQSDLHHLFRRCALAVLNTGSESDDAKSIFEEYADFSIEVSRRPRGLKLVIQNAPPSAFVEGRLIEGIREHLFAVLRDVVYIGTEIRELLDDGPHAGERLTDAVFQILKHARIMAPAQRPNLVVCWGGHSITRHEYDYTKRVGYELGLRRLDICTGCGPGAMKGPMKGAAVGHAKQRVEQGRYLGLSEPGIIAAEPPNPMVNQLVVMPDIEKRLEAFVRLAHGIVVFPGGVGTAEEILYLLGILLDPANDHLEVPLIFTAPAASRAYFERMDAFLRLALGEQVATKYEIIIGDAAGVGERMRQRIKDVRSQRRRDGDAFYYNWLLKIGEAHQQPFQVTHDSVAALRLSRDLPGHELAAELRRAFSAMVTGNVKAHGIQMVEENGPFELRSDAGLVDALEQLLDGFVQQGRMKITGNYRPCYQVIPV